MGLLFAVEADAQRQMEKLGRGLIAIRQSSTQVYVGWRMLGTDPEIIGFKLFRVASGVTNALSGGAVLTNTTDFVDATANLGVANAYYVVPTLNGVDQPPSAPFTLPANAPIQQYLSIPLQPPPGGTSPASADGTDGGGPYTYNANDCSVGDLDGDGEYEIILKWDPSNSKDNSQSGYTGDTYLDAYKLNGTRLWRIDLGPNIRAGAHYLDFMVYDFDGDGKAEVICRTAPGSKDGGGNYVGGAAKWQNSGGTRPAFNDTDDYRTTGPNGNNGYVLAGPEFLTVFDGLTGVELATTAYVPKRDPDNDDENPSASRINTVWGDSYGNRIDRFLAGVAYLDGKQPSAVFCRGYYTRTFLVAWDWRDGKLTRRWVFDSNDGTPGNTAYRGQGAHSLTIGDVDGDGRDEITYGACAIDHDGKGLYTTGIGHGDAEHLSDLDPNRPGLEVWMVHEDPGSYGPTGLEMHDARTGAVIFGLDGQNADVGRGVAIDIDPRYPGYEMWGARGGLMSATGAQISSGHPSSMNFAIWWDADWLREILDGTTISKWNWLSGTTSTLLSPAGLASNNSTKATPCLSADILGDWREEVIWRTSDNSELRIYTTTIPATNRFYTLMHDPQYRCAIAWQNTGYNQPPHPGFFLGQDMYPQPRPPISTAKLVWRGGAAGNSWDSGATANWVTNGVWTTNNPATVFNSGDTVLFDISGSNNVPVNFTDALAPGNVTVYSPKDYVFGGTGSLGGAVSLLKAGQGKLTINTTNSFTGPTTVSGGALIVNGRLDQSPVTVECRGTPEGRAQIGGNGLLGQGLTVQFGCSVMPGGGSNSPGTLTISNSLVESGGVLNQMDLSDDPSGTVKTNDLINVAGNVTLTGTNTFVVNGLNGQPPPGTYRLLQYSGTLAGSLANLAVDGLPGIPLFLINPPGAIALVITTNRAATNLVWAGGPGSAWNLATTSNWLNGAVLDQFVPLDNVRFDNAGAAAPTVTLAGYLKPGSVVVDSTANYTLGGSGDIIGSGSLTKTNSGTLTINTTNDYTGLTVLGGGVVAVSKLASGGSPSAIGASTGQSSNLVFYGGTLRYTGPNLITDRGATLGSGGGTIEVTSSSTALALGGAVEGGGSLTKLGTGTLTLNASSTFGGGTFVRAGTLELGTTTANTSGLGSGSVTLTNGGVLALFASDAGDTSAGGPFPNALNVPTNTTGAFYTPFRFTVNSTLTGGGTLILRVNGVRCDFNGNGSAFTGQINVTSFSGADNFRVNNSAGYPNAKINLAAGVSLQNRVGGTPTIPIGELSGASAATISAPGGNDGLPVIWRVGGLSTSATFAGTNLNNVGFIKEGTGTWTLTGSNSYSGLTTISGGSLQIGSGGSTGTLGAGNVVNNALLVFNRTGTLNYGGAISGNGAVTKLGSGVLALSGSGTYSGATTVSAGTLALTNNATLSGTTNISLAAGTLLDVSGRTGGSLTLASGQTLAGFGSVKGDLIVASGAKLAPGGFVGALTFSNTLTLSAGSTTVVEIQKSPLTNDVIRVSGALTNGGSLSVINTGAAPLTAGDTFKIFYAASYGGSFASTSLPPLDSGLAWDTSALATNGTLKVITAVPPVISSVSWLGGADLHLTFSGPAGQAYEIRSATNVALTPITLWDMLGTGVFGANPVVFDDWQATNYGRRFYRIRVP